MASSPSSGSTASTASGWCAISAATTRPTPDSAASIMYTQLSLSWERRSARSVIRKMADETTKSPANCAHEREQQEPGGGLGGPRPRDGEHERGTDRKRGVGRNAQELDRPQASGDEVGEA